MNALSAFAGSRAARALILAVVVTGAYLVVRAMRRAGTDERDERRARLGMEDA